MVLLASSRDQGCNLERIDEKRPEEGSSEQTHHMIASNRDLQAAVEHSASLRVGLASGNLALDVLSDRNGRGSYQCSD